MSRVRFPAGTGDAKGLRAEEDFPHSRGQSSGTQENILRTVAKAERCLSSFHGLCCVMMLS